jgi:hypothetical protein
LFIDSLYSGGERMENINFKELLFFIEVLNIAKQKGFKIRKKNDILVVNYPGFYQNPAYEVKNFQQLLELCNEITLWK